MIGLIDQLDGLADSLEKQNPKIALAIDKVNTAAKTYKFTE
jgi:hypothetical protein